MSSSIPNESQARKEAQARRGRVKFLLLVLLFSTPMLASYLAYSVWRPSGGMNYGELLALGPLPDVAMKSADGRDFRLADFKGKWVLLHVDSGECSERCERKLYLMRQVRLAQGKNLERIERAFLIDDEAGPAARLTREYEGTRFVYAQGSAVLQKLPAAQTLRDHVYLLDPLGNLVLRYPSDPDAKKVVRDLERLLKVSQIG